LGQLVGAAFVAVALALCIPAGLVRAQEDPKFAFELLSSASEEFAGISGDPFGPFEVLAAIRPLGEPGTEGPRAWSLAVTQDPVLEIQQIGMDGTSAMDLIEGTVGFFQAEAVDPAVNGGLHGFIVRAEIPISSGLSLPPDRPSTVIAVTYRGFHPAVEAVAEREISIGFAQGLVAGGISIQNQVTVGLEQSVPVVHSLTRRLKTTPSCSAGLSLELRAAGGVLREDGMAFQFDLPAGQELILGLTVRLKTTLAGSMGPEGWSLSIQHDQPFFQILEASTEGTDVDAFADPQDHYEKTETIQGEDGTGFISAVILSLAAPRVLPPAGEFIIARARYRFDAPHDTPGLIVATPFRFQAGLSQGNVPVDNIFTVEGRSEKPCVQKSLTIQVNILPGGKVFSRGDANNDTRFNLSDAVWLILWLYFGGDVSSCPAASDANGDHGLDTADAIFILDYLFQSGRGLPEPFPHCAPDPRTDNPLPCEEADVKCP